MPDIDPVGPTIEATPGTLSVVNDPPVVTYVGGTSGKNSTPAESIDVSLPSVAQSRGNLWILTFYERSGNKTITQNGSAGRAAWTKIRDTYDADSEIRITIFAVKVPETEIPEYRFLWTGSWNVGYTVHNFAGAVVDTLPSTFAESVEDYSSTEDVGPLAAANAGAMVLICSNRGNDGTTSVYTAASGYTRTFYEGAVHTWMASSIKSLSTAGTENPPSHTAWSGVANWQRAEALVIEPFTIDLTSQAISPVAPAITATPGTVEVGASGTQYIALEGVNVDVAAGIVIGVGGFDPLIVTATPGTVEVTLGAAPITPEAVIVSATPGALTIDTEGSVSVEAPTVEASPGSLFVSSGPIDISPVAASVSVTSGSVTISVQAVVDHAALQLQGKTLPMATTVDDHVQQIIRTITGEKRGVVNRTTGLVLATDTQLTLAAEPLDVTAGSWLGIGAEILYVEAVSGKTLTVQRAQFETQAGEHLANTRIEVNWRYFTADVMDAVRTEITSWDEEIYRLVSTTAVVSSARTLEMDWPTYRHLLAAELVPTAGDHPRDVFSSLRVSPTIGDTTPTITLDAEACQPGTLYLSYAGDFTIEPFALTTDLATGIGLSPSLNDVCRYGAMSRLMDGSAGSRVDRSMQGHPAAADEVGPLDESRLAGQYFTKRERRLGEERNRLRHMFPVRF